MIGYATGNNVSGEAMSLVKALEDAAKLRNGPKVYRGRQRSHSILRCV